MPEPARRSASPRRHRSRSPSAARDGDGNGASTSDAERRERRARRRARREAREARHAAKKAARREHRRREAAQPSRLPDARGFGANLFAAERAERARQEEREWAAKLGDLLEDDDAEWGCGLGAGEEYVPRRWGGMREMDDEGHADYMRRGMHRRRAGPAPSTGGTTGQSSSSYPSAGASAKPSRPVRGPAPAPPSSGPSAQELSLVAAHDAYSARWTALLDASKTGAVRHADIPWPVPDTGLGPPHLSVDALRTFLLSPLPAPQAPPPAERLRTALRRFHPDRFFSAPFWKRVEDEAERERIEKDVLRVAQGLNELVAERRDS